MRTLIKRRPLFFIVISLLGIVIILTNLRYGYVRNRGEASFGNVELSGRITERQRNSGFIVVYLKNIKINGQSANEFQFIKTEYLREFGRNLGVVCYFDEEKYSLSDFTIGNTVIVSGDLSTFNIASNPGEFDMCKYNLSAGYGLSMRKANVKSVISKKMSVREPLVKLRERGCDIITQYMGTRDGGIMKALIFADKSDLSKEDKALFKEGGVLHILSISGLHISLLGELLVFLIIHIGLPQKIEKKVFRFKYLLPVVLIVLYGLMLGFHASAVRAIIMFIVASVARVTGKSVDGLTSLALSAAITIILYPYMCLDAGFQLSYIAIVGIQTVGNAFLDYHSARPQKLNKFLSGTAVSVITLPVIMNSYYQVPVYATIANIFVLPCMSVLILAGMGIVIFGSWSWVGNVFFVSFLQTLAKVCAGMATAILFLIRRVCMIVSMLPGNTYVSGHRSLPRVVIFYVVIIGVSMLVIELKRYLWIKKRVIKNYVERNKYTSIEGRKVKFNPERVASERKWLDKTNYIVKYGWITVYVLCVVFICIPNLYKDQITFLDVGQGDGIALITNRSCVMVDGGSTSMSKAGQYVIEPYIKYMGKRKVDMWFLTHADSDHVSGFREILESGEIGIEAVCIPAVLSDTFSDVIGSCMEKGIGIYLLTSGDKVTIDDYEYVCLSPDKADRYKDENSASLVLLIKKENDVSNDFYENDYLSGKDTGSGDSFYQPKDADYADYILLMGDAEAEAEKSVTSYLNSHNITNISILKCAHHGSAINTNSYEFLSRIKAERAVLSCGKDNPYGHPHVETLEYLQRVGSDIRITYDEGAITYYLH